MVHRPKENLSSRVGVPGMGCPSVLAVICWITEHIRDAQPVATPLRGVVTESLLANTYRRHLCCRSQQMAWSGRDLSRVHSRTRRYAVHRTHLAFASSVCYIKKHVVRRRTYLWRVGPAVVMAVVGSAMLLSPSSAAPVLSATPGDSVFCLQPTTATIPARRRFSRSATLPSHLAPGSTICSGG